MQSKERKSGEIRDICQLDGVCQMENLKSMLQWIGEACGCISLKQMDEDSDLLKVREYQIRERQLRARSEVLIKRQTKRGVSGSRPNLRGDQRLVPVQKGRSRLHNSVIAGRKPISEWERALDDWDRILNQTETELNAGGLTRHGESPLKAEVKQQKRPTSKRTPRVKTIPRLRKVEKPLRVTALKKRAEAQRTQAEQPGEGPDEGRAETPEPQSTVLAAESGGAVDPTTSRQPDGADATQSDPNPSSALTSTPS